MNPPHSAGMYAMKVAATIIAARRSSRRSMSVVPPGRGNGVGLHQNLEIDQFPQTFRNNGMAVGIGMTLVEEQIESRNSVAGVLHERRLCIIKKDVLVPGEVAHAVVE